MCAADRVVLCWETPENAYHSRPPPLCCRKKCQMFTNLIMLTAALFMGFSKMAKSFEMILLGRLLYGIGIGSYIGLAYGQNSAVIQCFRGEADSRVVNSESFLTQASPSLSLFPSDSLGVIVILLTQFAPSGVI